MLACGGRPRCLHAPARGQPAPQAPAEAACARPSAARGARRSLQPGRNADSCSRAERRATACSAAGPSVNASATSPGGRHAVLHDFCMVIPYSSIVLLAGLGSLFFGAGWKGAALAAAGALELWLTLQSLKLWRAGAEHRAYTSGTAGIALALGSAFFKSARAGGLWPKLLLGLLSLAAAIFLIHNVAAGGNPPKGDPAYTAADAMRPHPTAS